MENAEIPCAARSRGDQRKHWDFGDARGDARNPKRAERQWPQGPISFTGAAYPNKDQRGGCRRSAFRLTGWPACRGVRLSSGYLADGAGQPGGGGLLLLEADSYAAAEALIREDPMLRGGDVAWSLHLWIGAIEDLDVR